MLVASNFRQTLGFFRWLEDLKLFEATGKALGKASVHSTQKCWLGKYSFKVQKKPSIITPCPQTRHQNINLKEDFVKSLSFALAMFTQVCTLEFSASLADLEPFFSRQVLCGLLMFKLHFGRSKLGLIHHLPHILSCSQHAVHSATLHLLQQQNTYQSGWIANTLWDVTQGHQVCCIVFGTLRVCPFVPGQFPVIQYVWIRQVWVKHPHPTINFFSW